MFEVIRIWLNSNREYFPGVAIAMQFHQNAAILAIMKQADHARNRERLLTIMQEEYARLKAEMDPARVKKTAGPRKAPQPDHQAPTIPSLHSNSPIYLAAKQEADMAFKQTMNLRAVLFNLARVEGYEDPNIPGKVQERSKLAIEVVLGYRKASKLYEKADFILQHGTVPTTTVTQEEDFQALPDQFAYKELANARKAYSKLKNKPATPERLALMDQHLQNIKKLEEQCRTLN